MVTPLRPGLVGTVVRQAGSLLVGREREIDVLTDALSTARSCVVHGATGMGKSALLSVASSIAVRSGLRPVRGVRALAGVDRHAVLVADDVERLSAEEVERLARFRGTVLAAGDVDPDELGLVDAVRVPLRPVDDVVVAEIVRRRADVSPDLVSLFVEFTGGAPGLVCDVLDTVPDIPDLPAVLSGLRLPRLLRAVRRHWETLDADAVAVARALAVLGSSEPDVLGEVSGLELFRARSAFERLVDARLAWDEPMRMRTPALRHAIRHETAPELRDRLHRTAADVLQRRCRSASSVAEHVLECAEPVGTRWAAPVLHDAARTHRAAGRPETAARCLRAALREPWSGDVAARVAMALADLHLRCGIPPRADELARLRAFVDGEAAEWLDAVALDWRCGELDPRGRARLVGAEQDWLTALEMWAFRDRGEHAEVARLMRELDTSPDRGCVALGTGAFVASCVDAGKPADAREVLVRLGYMGALPTSWAHALLSHHRSRMHLALGAPRAAVWDELTPHESRIVRLVLEGETNREIAARFGVTRRAVELHLTRVYRKAGISRRVQLPLVFGS
ncbi:LuxR C-terminal-related transcriptional regulator [Lentzea sp. NPDC059081]|uniref:helix-turn-helix transcriptional regulator n=1 Tax=Lentzea sp. NPDC059081 TaxID=3346719 RepID=UPI0036794196